MKPEITHSFWKCISEIREIVSEILIQKENEAQMFQSQNNNVSDIKFKMEFEIISSKYKREILGILKNKSIKDLDKLKRDIQKKLSSAKFMMDRDYWESLCLAIKLQKAQMGLSQFYEDFKEYLGTFNIIKEAPSNHENDSILFYFKISNQNFFLLLILENI